MSERMIKAFFDKIEVDEGLRARLQKLGEENERKAVAQVVEIAAEAGFTFTPNEYIKVRARRVEFFPGFGEEPQEESKQCCHWAKGCMPGFCPIN